MPSCESVAVLNGHSGDVIALAFSPDSTHAGQYVRRPYRPPVARRQPT